MTAISQADYMTVPAIAKDAGVELHTVHNWINYHRYMTAEQILDRPAIKKSDYARFKREHPELIKSASQ